MTWVLLHNVDGSSDWEMTANSVGTGQNAPQSSLRRSSTFEVAFGKKSWVAERTYEALQRWKSVDGSEKEAALAGWDEKQNCLGKTKKKFMGQKGTGDWHLDHLLSSVKPRNIRPQDTRLVRESGPRLRSLAKCSLILAHFEPTYCIEPREKFEGGSRSL